LVPPQQNLCQTIMWIPTSTRSMTLIAGQLKLGKLALPMPTKVFLNSFILIPLGATMGEALPSEYITKNNKVAERQLVIAAIRLANTIEMIYNPKETKPEKFLGNMIFLQ